MMNASTSSPAPEENGASPLLLDRTMSLSTSTSDYTISSGSADEGTSLLNSDTERSSNYCTGDDDRLNSSSPADAASSSEEMTNPWPATFERSVMLLSKPFADRALVEYASESMHILPPTKLKKNTSLTSLNRGWRTPDPENNLDKRRACDGCESDDVDGGGVFQRLGIQKPLSLDWLVGEEGLSKQKPGLEYLQKVPEDTARVTAANVTEGKTTFGQCVFNMSNTLMGMGILSLPFCLKAAGWVGGLSSLVIFGIVAWWTSILIGRQLNGDPRSRNLMFKNDYSNKTLLDAGKEISLVRLRGQLSSFPAIARDAFGQNGNIVLSSVLYFELFSALAVFYISLGDHLHSLFPSVSTTHHMMLVSNVLIVTTVFLKTPQLISYLSTVGTFTTITVVLSVVVIAFWRGDMSEDMPQLHQQNSDLDMQTTFHSTFVAAGLPVSFGLVAYTFGGHAVVPTIYNSMAQPRDFERMMTVSFAIVLTCCIMVAVSGYYMFGTTVSDQITLSLGEAPINSDFVMTVLTWLMVITSLSKFPLYLFPLALGVEEIIAPYVATDQAMELSFMVIKFSLIASSLVVAIFIPSFAFLCSLVGLICTVIVSVIFPAASHLKLFGSELKAWEKVIDYVLIFGGLIIGVVGTITTLKGSAS